MTRANGLGRDPEGFRRKQGAALAKRLFPKTSLRVKDLAYAIGAHPDSIGNWLRGECTLDGPTIAAIDAFFVSAGDYGFVGELFGDLALRRLMKAEALQRQARALEAEAAALKGQVA